MMENISTVIEYISPEKLKYYNDKVEVRISSIAYDDLIKKPFYTETESLTETRSGNARTENGWEFVDLDFANLLWNNYETSVFEDANGECEFQKAAVAVTSGALIINVYKSNSSRETWSITVHRDTGSISFGDNGVGEFTSGRIVINYDKENIYCIDEKFIPETIARKNENNTWELINSLTIDNDYDNSLTISLDSNNEHFSLKKFYLYMTGMVSRQSNFCIKLNSLNWTQQFITSTFGLNTLNENSPMRIMFSIISDGFYEFICQNTNDHKLRRDGERCENGGNQSNIKNVTSISFNWSENSIFGAGTTFVLWGVRE